MLGHLGPAQPSPALGDVLNAGYLYLEVKYLGCDTHQTIALDDVRRPKTTPIPRVGAVHAVQRIVRRCGANPCKRSHHRRTATDEDFSERPRRRRGGRESGEVPSLGVLLNSGRLFNSVLVFSAASCAFI